MPSVLRRWLCLVAALAGLTLVARLVPHEPRAPTSRAPSPVPALAALPLRFERNDGQLNPAVRFVGRGLDYNLFLNASEAVFAFRPQRGDGHPTKRPAIVRMSFVGSNPDSPVIGRERQPGTSHYFLSRAAKPSLGATNYRTVAYKGVYPGVDVVYHGTQAHLEYDFVVAPNIPIDRIAMRFDGAGTVRIQANGSLALATTDGTLVQHKPVAYQVRNGHRTFVDAKFVSQGDGRIAFAVGPYDRSRSIVIDPVIAYDANVGGSHDDYSMAVAVDRAGNTYVTGYTLSYDFPMVGAFQPKKAPDGTYYTTTDAFVFKLNPSGTGLLYSSYLGGSGSDAGLGIAVDDSGSAYVVGQTTSLDFPVHNALQPAYGGGNNDAFVARINPAGNGLVYSTYLGGSGTDVDVGAAIVVDAAHAAYVTAYTTSANFPVRNAYQPTLNGPSDAFISKLTSTGSALAFSTYLGGERAEYAGGIAVDAAGNSYVTGATESFSFPTINAKQPTGHGSDAFVSRFSASGVLTYSTYLGDPEGAAGRAIAVDRVGNMYVTGITDGYFPLENPLQVHPAGSDDLFLTKYNAAGDTYIYSTLLGGGNRDIPTGIAVDRAGNAYVTGSTRSVDFPTAAATQPALGLDSDDGFVLKINASGSKLLFSTFFGDRGHDAGNGIALADNDDIYIAAEKGIYPLNSDWAVVKKYALPTARFWRADFDGDLKSDIMWRNSLTGAGSIMFSAANNAASRTVNTDWTIATIADFDGDGRSDIFWRNLVTGANVIWKSANPQTQQGAATVSDYNWKIVGSGDFNGDHKADVLWRNVATGADVVWLGGRSTALAPLTSVTDLGWEVVGVGDFDGDGMADIFWRHGTSGKNVIWRSGSSVTLQLLPIAPSNAWRIAVGDFDGDGKADILWRNAVTGANQIWKAGVSTDQLAIAAVTNPVWQVTGTGDYDGDGRADVLWRNVLTGNNVVWRAANAGAQLSVPGATSSDWNAFS